MTLIGFEGKGSSASAQPVDWAHMANVAMFKVLRFTVVSFFFVGRHQRKPVWASAIRTKSVSRGPMFLSNSCGFTR